MPVTITPAVLLTSHCRCEDGYAHLLQQIAQALCREERLPAIACAIQSDNQAVSDELVLPHALDIHEFLQVAIAPRTKSTRQSSKQQVSSYRLEGQKTK